MPSLLTILVLAMALPDFPDRPGADAPAAGAAMSAAASIEISSTPEVLSGTSFCFEITCTSTGIPSVLVELGGAKLDADVAPGHEPNTWIVCVSVPPGTGGSDLEITAVGSDGSVATANVAVTG